MLSESEKEKYKEIYEQHRKDFETKMNNIIKKFDDIENDFERKLRIEAPKTYWSQKAARHIRGFWVSFSVFCAIIAGGMFWFLENGISIYNQGFDRLIETEQTGLITMIPILKFAIPVLAIAWILRHLSRIIIENLHLMEDAKLRSTIAETYLAINRNQEVSETEKAIILNALFRPIDGSSHSEIAPPNLEEILRLTGGEKR